MYEERHKLFIAVGKRCFIDGNLLSAGRPQDQPRDAATPGRARRRLRPRRGRRAGKSRDHQVETVFMYDHGSGVCAPTGRHFRAFRRSGRVGRGTSSVGASGRKASSANAERPALLLAKHGTTALRPARERLHGLYPLNVRPYFRIRAWRFVRWTPISSAARLTLPSHR